LLCFGWGAIAASSRQDLGQLALGPAAVIMHHAWAMGFLTGFAETRTVTSGG
jgi:hypothetical protein